VAEVGYVFVRQAPADYDARLKAQFPIPQDPPLHFVAVTAGPFNAFAVLVGNTRAEVKNLVTTKLRTAGGSGFEVTFSNPGGIQPDGLRWGHV
jgi:hypothetical protein